VIGNEYKGAQLYIADDEQAGGSSERGFQRGAPRSLRRSTRTFKIVRPAIGDRPENATSISTVSLPRPRAADPRSVDQAQRARSWRDPPAGEDQEAPPVVARSGVEPRRIRLPPGSGPWSARELDTHRPWRSADRECGNLHPDQRDAPCTCTSRISARPASAQAQGSRVRLRIRCQSPDPASYQTPRDRPNAEALPTARSFTDLTSGSSAATVKASKSWSRSERHRVSCCGRSSSMCSTESRRSTMSLPAGAGCSGASREARPASNVRRFPAGARSRRTRV